MGFGPPPFPYSFPKEGSGGVSDAFYTEMTSWRVQLSSTYLAKIHWRSRLYHWNQVTFKHQDQSYHLLRTYYASGLILGAYRFFFFFLILNNTLAQMVKATASSAGDPCLIPGLGRSPGEGNGNPLQYSFLENSMKRRAW